MKEVRGMVLPSPTVFREDGRVDEPLMRELTEWFVASGVQAFFILGSYGQGAAMHPEERKNVAEIVVQQVKHRVPVVVHIGAVDPLYRHRPRPACQGDRCRGHRPCRALLLR